MKNPVVLGLLLAASAVCDVVYECEATARDGNGNTSPVACQSNSPTPQRDIISGSGRDISINILNLVTGGVYDPAGTMGLDVVLRSRVYASQEFVITGGTGSGTLLFGGFSHEGNWGQFNSVRTSAFQSSFLPAPPNGMKMWGDNYSPYIEYSFVFDQPFTLWVSSEFEVRAESPYSATYVAWETMHQWDAYLADIVDSEGQSVTTAIVSPIPEPRAWALLIPVLLWACFAARSKYGSAKSARSGSHPVP